MLINELEAAEPDESFYDAKVKVLSELIEHHVKEEEKQRDNLFQQTRAADIDLEALGAQLAARKAELLAKAEERGPAARRAGDAAARGDLSMAWSRKGTIIAGDRRRARRRRPPPCSCGAGAAAARSRPAAGRSSAARPRPAPVGQSGAARSAGPEAMRDPPEDWEQGRPGLGRELPGQRPARGQPARRLKATVRYCPLSGAVLVRPVGEDRLAGGAQLADRLGGRPAPDEMGGDHHRVAAQRMAGRGLQHADGRDPAHIGGQPDRRRRPPRRSTRPSAGLAAAISAPQPAP